VADQVKGILFADYVRMIRSNKAVDWSTELPAEDLPYLSGQIASDAWYPMATFERLGNAILRRVANNDLEGVRMWGYFSVDALIHANPMLLAQNDPIETLTRFRILRAGYFDFPALEIPELHEGHALVEIGYRMGQPAEEAASYQTMGFFERLVARAGGKSVSARFIAKAWAGDPVTRLEISWVSA
jgi:hypothetical protein